MNKKWIGNMVNWANMNTDYQVKLIGEMDGRLGAGSTLWRMPGRTIRARSSMRRLPYRKAYESAVSASGYKG